MQIAPDITKLQRDELEGEGLTLRAIDDAVAKLRVSQPNEFTTRDILATAKVLSGEGN